MPGRESGSSADPALIKAIARGHAWFAELASGQAATIAAIAAREKVTDRYVSSLLKLAFLPPNLVTACLAGEATALSTKAAVTSDRAPLLWNGRGGCSATGQGARLTVPSIAVASSGMQARFGEGHGNVAASESRVRIPFAPPRSLC